MLRIGRDVKIDDTARIKVEKGLIGDRSVIRAHAVIEGREIVIGKEAWIDEYSYIGGGSCFEFSSRLKVGDFLHMGRFSHLNQGMGLTIGDEFGCGINTKVFTHGAYESAWDGFPVQWGSTVIGDRVWLPNAWVNPGVKIGNDVVVAALSVVTDDLPSGCLAGGVPCRILREDAFPRKLTYDQKSKLFESIFDISRSILESRRTYKSVGRLGYSRVGEDSFNVEGTVFDLANRKIAGSANEFTEILKNQLRRNGIRFRYFCKDGAYVKW